MKNVVVIGGGHGLSTILKGIKEIEDINISAIVTVADDGGSTGRIRELYNIPAMGDIRNCLVALSGADSTIKELMDFRFEGKTKEDIVGHALGNLMLTALTQMTGSFAGSIDTLASILKIKGEVFPSSLEPLVLYALMDDETIVKGQASIPSFNHHISEVFYDHEVKANAKAVKTINNADLIIYGIGSLYTSIAPNTIIPAIQDALSDSKALKVYFANCMTQSNETFNFDLKDHIDALKKHGAIIDIAIKHKETIPSEILKRYEAQNSIEVIDHKDSNVKVFERELLDFSNNLVRHDPNKIKDVVKEIVAGVIY